jgi:hypothetical protein
MSEVSRGLAVSAIAAVVLSAGCSPSTRSAAPPQSASAQPTSTTAPAGPATVPALPATARGAEQGIGDVPWAQVGPGWVLAVWSPLTPHRPGEAAAPGEPDPDNVTTVLYLVDPAGDRYSITEFPPGDGDPRLVDWSGDGSHALFETTKSGKDAALSVDLHTGTRTTTPVSGTPRYTRPGGTAILESTSFSGNEPGTLKRIDMAGNAQLTYPADTLGGAGQFSGDYLESPDGTQLVLGTANLGNQIVPRSDNSLVIVANDGTIVRTLPAPMPKAYCAPMKWWAPRTVLAHCTAEGGSAEQLWEVPLDGGKAIALTAVNTDDNAAGFVGDYGNATAFQLPSGIFLPTAGACGTTFVSRLTPDGHTERVQIPGVSDSASLAGVIGDKLAIVARVGCGGGESLLAYDPVANTAAVLLGPPSIGGGVDDVRLYPGGQ